MGARLWLVQAKYLYFIDIYAALDDNERQRYEREYPLEAEQMSHFAERFRQEGEERGRQKGEAALLLRLLERRFGSVSPASRKRIQSADAETLLRWSDRLLDAESVEDVLH